MSKDGQPRILITRLSAIGDCILTLPLLCALRRAYPHAMIAWAVQPAAAKILDGHECLDELIVVPRGWLKSPKEIWKLRQRLRKLQFDVTIDPQSLLKSATAAWLSGARQRIGFAPPLGREQSFRVNNVIVRSQTMHVVDRHLELLEPMHVHAPSAEFRLPTFGDEASRVSVMLGQMRLRAKEFAVVNPGATWASKRWPVERFSRLAVLLGQRCGIPSIVVWAGNEEHQWARKVVDAAGKHALLAPSTSLRELAELVRQAAFVVAGDTGPLHLAAAAGTTCIGLFGATDARLSGPYGMSHIVVQKYFQPGSSRERRSASNDAMRAIEVDEVFAACERAWKATGHRCAA